MKTEINGIEITPEMVEVFDKWYGNAISAEDTLPYGYVKELGKLQEFFCHMIYDIDEHPELKRHISFVTNLKDDLKMFIPEKGGKA
jgi:hypothetical protein